MAKKKISTPWQKWLESPVLWITVFVVLYVVSRWTGLTQLPIFADEAIYIRWSQLLRQGPEYLFFPMNDGKPPLFMWSLFPWLQTFSDPLGAARSWSAVLGLAQAGVIFAILRTAQQNKRAQLIGAFLVLLTPFWFIHHRLALMDGLLTLGLSLSFWGLSGLDVLTSKTKKSLSLAKVACWILLAGTSWGVALLTKTTALFFAPVFFGLAVLGASWDIRAVFTSAGQKILLQRLVAFGAAGALGLVIFAALRISPTFGSLFSRGGDFTYSLDEWIKLGGQPLLNNLRRVLPWIAEYLRPELFTFAVASLIFSSQKRQHAMWWVSGFVTILPLIVLGETLHPRYFLPLIPFITLSAASFVDETWSWLSAQWAQGSKEVVAVSFAVVVIFLISCVRFQVLMQWAPQLTPFVLDDRDQYLTSWAAGYGIPETRDRLIERARQGQRTTIVTEGSFGTLPDGLLLYFDRAPEIAHLRIEGLAQHPVLFLPDWVLEEANKNETWLMVNENRFQLSPEQRGMTELIGQYKKPYGGPPLLLLRVLPSE